MKKIKPATSKKVDDKVSAKTRKSENGFETLLSLFEHTHTSMQKQIANVVSSALVARNWLFGWYITEFEKQTSERSEIYGKKLMEKLSERLSLKLGRGFSRRSLDQFRLFYEQYQKIGQTLFAESSIELKEAAKMLLERSRAEDKKIRQTVSAESFSKISRIQPGKLNLSRITETLSANLMLSWSHYLFLLGVSNPDERRFYELEAANGNWSLRELKRQFASSLYERLALSKDKAGVKKLSEKGLIVEENSDVLKEPYVLEFLGLDEKNRYSETELETAIIDKLEHFLLELGKGFLFEARQKRFTFDDEHFYVDLVFYNRLLRCYVLIDLKIGSLKHQDLGQMQMYVNYFDRYVKLPEEEPTIGIVLCKKKNDSLVKITLPENANIHAAKYLTYLPDKSSLKKQLEEAQKEWEQNHETEI